MKRNFQILPPLDFLAEFTQHIPPKGSHLIRYYGWYSNKSRGVRKKAPAGGPSVNLSASTAGPLPSVSVNAGSHEFQVPVGLHAATTINVASGASWEFNHRLNLNGNTLAKTGAGTMATSNDVVLGDGGTINLQQGIISGNGPVPGHASRRKPGDYSGARTWCPA